MIDYFGKLEEEIEKGLSEDQIPMGFDRLSRHVGIRKSTYYLLGGYTGCLAYGTKVVMFDGSLKEVQDVKIGDQLMGLDSTPRTVLKLFSGVDDMYKIVQNKGMDYTVNSEHILSLRKRRKKVDEYLNISVKDFLKKSETFQGQWKGYKSEGIDFPEKSVEIDPYFLGLWIGDGTACKRQITTADKEIVDYLYEFANKNNLKVKKYVKDEYRYDLIAKKSLKRTLPDGKVEFYNSIEEAAKLLNCSPKYISNIVRNLYCNYCGKDWEWIVKDSSLLKFFELYNLTCNKYIPKHFLINSRENRLKLLAGLIDSDGHLQTGRNGYEITMKSKEIIEQIAFLSRSLGFYTSINPKRAVLKREGKANYECDVYRIFIFGEKLGEIPCKLPRKKAKNTIDKVINPLSTGIKIEHLGKSNYYGFELDGDHLFLLEDFTVTHNSGKTSLLDDAFVLNPYDFVISDKNTSNIKLKIFYFSMERRKNYKLAKWISRKVFIDTGFLISVNKILGWVNKENKLTKDEHDLIKGYKDYVNYMLNDVITIIENPQNPMGIKKTVDNYADLNGKKEKLDEHNYIYIPNNPKELVLVIYDHIGLQKKETRSYPNGDKVRLSTKKEIIDQSSEDARKFRDFYGYSPIKVSQFNRDIANPVRLKNGDVEPMLEDFKDSGATQEDADVILSLFDPMRYNVPDPSGYDLTRLRNEYGAKMFRSVKVLKNSYGSDDIRIGLAFQPAIGHFKELPKVQDMNQGIYNSVLDNSYFQNKKQ